MTIAIGVMAEDGIVVAADTQESTGVLLKGDKQKMVSFGTGMSTDAKSVRSGACVIAGAGDSGHTRSLIDQLGFVFMTERDLPVMALPNNKTKSLMREFRSCLQSFYKEHIIPLAAFPRRERPDVETLIAFYRNYQPHLYYTEKTAIIFRGRYKAIGLGSTFAELLLDQFCWQRMSIAEAQVLAAYVIFMTKESVEDCGKYTGMLTLTGEKFFVGGEDVKGDGVIYTPWQTITEWEHLFRTKWRDAECNLMRRQVEEQARKIGPKKKRRRSAREMAKQVLASIEAMKALKSQSQKSEGRQ
jgi:20S proteasome alpha/beta subunit